jgi:hypothetical protein
MRRFAIAIVLLNLACWACSPAPNSTAPPAPATAPAAAPPAAAKKAVMVCRNSQTGAKAECGTPNAVMVGIKEN